MRKVLPLFAIALAPACTAEPTADHPLEFAVGADGGSLRTGRLRIEVPAGAVSGDITVTAYATDRVIDGVTTASRTWVFGPEGQTFDTPITVSLAFDGQPAAATLWWTRAGDPNTFANLQTEVADGWAAASIAHFSQGAVGDGDECDDGSDDGGDDADTDNEQEGDDDADGGDDDGDHGDCEHDDHGDDEGDDADDGDDGDDGDDADGGDDGGDDTDAETDD
jgi:hypothetical protein